MTVFFDEYEKIFKRMSRPFFDIGDIVEDLENNSGTGPFYYGYTVTVGPDGKPVVKEYGNVKPGLLPTADVREPIVDVIGGEKEGHVKLVAEMPGVEKGDVKITVHDNVVDISASRGDKRYQAKIPLRHQVDEGSARAAYKNGVLELSFKLPESAKPDVRTVRVE